MTVYDFSHVFAKTNYNFLQKDVSNSPTLNLLGNKLVRVMKKRKVSMAERPEK